MALLIVLFRSEFLSDADVIREFESDTRSFSSFRTNVLDLNKHHQLLWSDEIAAPFRRRATASAACDRHNIPPDALPLLFYIDLL